MSTACVALSGGVDSALTAALLAEEGHDIRAVTLRLVPGSGSDASVEAAAAVACHLGIAHEVVDVRDEFSSHVVEAMCEGYARGLTPNPCVTCNRVVKFGILADIAWSLGCDFLATGHYARVRDVGGRAAVCRAIDDRKDQSYFLWGIEPAVLGRVRFPLGALTKTQVREEAAQRRIPVSQRAESQDVCFAERSALRELIVSCAPKAGMPGEIVDREGRVLGVHDGIASFTIGQRKGLDIRDGSGPHYVISIDAESNRVVVGSQHGLECTRVETEGGVIGVDDGARVMAMVRYRMQPQPAVVSRSATGIEVEFDDPVKGVAPGQSVVCYVDDCVVAGGEIACAS